VRLAHGVDLDLDAAFCRRPDLRHPRVGFRPEVTRQAADWRPHSRFCFDRKIVHMHDVSVETFTGILRMDSLIH
jgi:hypothetical protein